MISESVWQMSLLGAGFGAIIGLMTFLGVIKLEIVVPGVLMTNGCLRVIIIGTSLFTLIGLPVALYLLIVPALHGVGQKVVGLFLGFVEGYILVMAIPVLNSTEAY